MYYLTWLTKDWKLREAICDSFRLVWESFGRQQNCFQKRTRSQAIWRNLLDWQLWIPSRYKIKWMNVKIEILISYFQYFSTHVVLKIEILQIRYETQRCSVSNFRLSFLQVQKIKCSKFKNKKSKRFEIGFRSGTELTQLFLPWFLLRVETIFVYIFQNIDGHD